MADHITHDPAYNTVDQLSAEEPTRIATSDDRAAG